MVFKRIFCSTLSIAWAERKKHSHFLSYMIEEYTQQSHIRNYNVIYPCKIIMYLIKKFYNNGFYTNNEFYHNFYTIEKVELIIFIFSHGLLQECIFYPDRFWPSSLIDVKEEKKDFYQGLMTINISMQCNKSKEYNFYVC